MSESEIAEFVGGHYEGEVPNGSEATQFQPGNTLGFVHGAHSRAMVAGELPPEISEKIEQLYEWMPVLRNEDRTLVEAYIRLRWRIDAMERYFDQFDSGIIDHKGRPRPAAKLYNDLLREAREHAKVLGLGPVARSQFMQAMAGAGRDAQAVSAAQKRIREKATSESAA
jgi:hypothetical protein